MTGRGKTLAMAWFKLFRPWSYTATAVPFAVAGAIAFSVSRRMEVSWTRWAAGFAAGLLFQATVNLLNTWGDEKSGVDDVPGAIRTTPQVHDGLVSMKAVFCAAAICASAAAAIGLALCFTGSARGEWGFDTGLLVVGAVGFLGATNYSTGIKFKYRGLGVPFVSVLMGPLEIAAALMLAIPGIAGRMASPDVSDAVFTIALLLMLSYPVAALVGVIMHGNDMRDIFTDRAAGIVTMASFLGPTGSLAYYFFAHLSAYLALVGIALFAGLAVGCLCAAWLFLPFAVFPLTVLSLRKAWRIYRENPGAPAWRGFERASGGIHFLFGLLYAVALVAYCRGLGQVVQ